ncbi:hypothetical protein OE88DRAFT_1667054 [Heliocybe sulcata]|uniref:Uncharacterized protein n=1 Tax=Heliocybe sulcata TaxID=5364 RepID=A0A5C3MPK1_9AGAM|nr:hypothetical protein OE88DRAFT_1667054 [Heliocybe sulcata]
MPAYAEESSQRQVLLTWHASCLASGCSSIGSNAFTAMADCKYAVVYIQVTANVRPPRYTLAIRRQARGDESIAQASRYVMSVPLQRKVCDSC